MNSGLIFCNYFPIIFDLKNIFCNKTSENDLLVFLENEKDLIEGFTWRTSKVMTVKLRPEYIYDELKIIERWKEVYSTSSFPLFKNI